MTNVVQLFWFQFNGNDQLFVVQVKSSWTCRHKSKPATYKKVALLKWNYDRVLIFALVPCLVETCLQMDRRNGSWVTSWAAAARSWRCWRRVRWWVRPGRGRAGRWSAPCQYSSSSSRHQRSLESAECPPGRTPQSMLLFVWFSAFLSCGRDPVVGHEIKSVGSLWPQMLGYIQYV